jgi:hypothetical protein
MEITRVRGDLLMGLHRRLGGKTHYAIYNELTHLYLSGVNNFTGRGCPVKGSHLSPIPVSTSPPPSLPALPLYLQRTLKL